MVVKKLIADKSFKTYFSEKDEEIQIPSFGKFAIIQETPTYIRIASDRIRSVPVFYTVDKSESILVSDDAFKITKQMTGGGIVNSSKREFLAASYVTGRNTLFSEVFTLLPGEIVTITKSSGEIERKQYYTCEYLCNGDKTEDEYIDLFDACLINVFKDLIATLNGRTAVLPLSGGCDSRIVAVMLKRLGYENVICFSYGRIGNVEAERSKAVAQALGYTWHFVEYNSTVWGDFYKSKEYKDFLCFSCRGSGIGCVQALPAILELKRKRFIPEDAVVVPGHALDFNAGSHLVKHGKAISKHKLAEQIFHTHYTLCRGADRTSVLDYSKDCPPMLNEKEAAYYYQQWEWINRQSKFIANDVRAYEFAGYDYELPFWDERVIRFWEQVPANLLYGRKLQYAYTATKIDPVCNQSIDYGFIVEPPRKKSVIKAVAKKILPSLLLKVRARIYDYHNNSNDFYSFMGFRRFMLNLLRYGMSYNLNTKIAKDTLSLYENIEKNN